MSKLLLQFLNVFALLSGLVWGSVLNQVLKIKTESFGIILLIGWFLQAILFEYLSLVFPLNVYTWLITTVLGLLLLLASGDRIPLPRGAEFRAALITGGALMLALKFAGPMIVDNGLYYQQTIKSIQEYSVIKGIANVNSRLGFNSNWHLLEAGNTLRPWLNTGTYGINFCLILVLCFDGIKNWFKGDNYRLTLAPVSYYILYKYMGVPGADFAVVVITWYLFDYYLSIEPKASVLIMLSALLITIKPSALIIAGIGIVALVSALSKKEQIKPLIFTVFLAVLLVAGWAWRNYYISGYAAYPITAIPAFNVPWKVPFEQVSEEADYVYASAKVPLNPVLENAHLPLSVWVPQWMAYVGLTNWLLVANALIFCFTILFAYALPLLKDFRHSRAFIVLIIGSGSLIFWFLTAPTFRFAYGVFYFFLLYNLDALIRTIPFSRKKLTVAAIYLGGIAITIPISLVYSHKHRKSPLCEKQSLAIVPLSNGIAVLETKGKSLCYDCGFPCTNFLRPGVKPMGSKIEDGFMQPSK